MHNNNNNIVSKRLLFIDRLSVSYDVKILTLSDLPMTKVDQVCQSSLRLKMCSLTPSFLLSYYSHICHLTDLIGGHIWLPLFEPRVSIPHQNQRETSAVFHFFLFCWETFLSKMTIYCVLLIIGNVTLSLCV